MALESWDYGSGAKLTEHSWVLNPFVRAFEGLIFRNPKRVVWAGDYADNEKNIDSNLYFLAEDKLTKSILPELPLTKSRYIINHTKKEFVDKYKVPSDDGWKVHPLPILTCEGNGQGGGDYFSKHGADFVGTWARNLISVDSKKPIGYNEIKPDFSDKN